MTKSFEDLSNEDVYSQHANLTIHIANQLLLPQRRTFVVDDRNKQIMRFLLYYFNDCPLAEEVFPDKHYKLHKNLLICGDVGTGKTLLMQIFSEYLKYTDNPNHFHNLSVTQMVNYYTIHNNLDRYTYNEESSVGFQIKPVNICLNDIGIESKVHFGMDTKVLTNEFLHARNEVWVHYRKHGHLTTNLSVAQLKEEFADSFGRLVDRFKTYNVIAMTGESRR
ncbi:MULTISPECIES: ATP-binding protein [unclassified Dysgonomonas]|uniref:ATP-binding protein n=1 Tax=unclassified Dysgonomonas TaxID=2630389 RepID=UPI0024770127|nr:MULTISPECIES: ATP-binding protein [unclassified Dysgonomonas]